MSERAVAERQVESDTVKRQLLDRWLDGQALGAQSVDSFLGHLHEEHEPLIREWLVGLRER